MMKTFAPEFLDEHPMMPTDPCEHLTGKASRDRMEINDVRCGDTADFCCETCGRWTCESHRHSRDQCFACFDDDIERTELLAMEARQ